MTSTDYTRARRTFIGPHQSHRDFNLSLTKSNCFPRSFSTSSRLMDSTLCHRIISMSLSFQRKSLQWPSAKPSSYRWPRGALILTELCVNGFGTYMPHILSTMNSRKIALRWSRFQETNNRRPFKAAIESSRSAQERRRTSGPESFANWMLLGTAPIKSRSDR